MEAEGSLLPESLFEPPLVIYTIPLDTSRLLCTVHQSRSCTDAGPKFHFESLEPYPNRFKVVSFAGSFTVHGLLLRFGNLTSSYNRLHISY